MEEWDRTAFIAAYVISPYVKCNVRIEDIQPMRVAEKRQRIYRAVMASGLLKDRSKEHLSNEETERQWRLLKQRLDDAERK